MALCQWAGGDHPEDAELGPLRGAGGSVCRWDFRGDEGCDLLHRGVLEGAWDLDAPPTSSPASSLWDWRRDLPWSPNSQPPLTRPVRLAHCLVPRGRLSTEEAVSSQGADQAQVPPCPPLSPVLALLDSTQDHYFSWLF